MQRNEIIASSTSNKVHIPLTFSSVINLLNVTVGSPHLEPPALYKSTITCQLYFISTWVQFTLLNPFLFL